MLFGEPPLLTLMDNFHEVLKGAKPSAREGGRRVLTPQDNLEKWEGTRKDDSLRNPKDPLQSFDEFGTRHMAMMAYIFVSAWRESRKYPYPIRANFELMGLEVSESSSSSSQSSSSQSSSSQSSSSSSSSSSQSPYSSSSGGPSGGPSGVPSNNSGSSKMAIVNGLGWFCSEEPQPMFHDTIIVDVERTAFGRYGGQVSLKEEYWKAVFVPSIRVVSVMFDSFGFVQGFVDMEEGVPVVKVQMDRKFWVRKPTKAVVRVEGIRRGFENTRHPRFDQKTVDKNNGFWNLAMSDFPFIVKHGK